MSTKMNGRDERICMFVMMLRRNSPKVVSDTRVCDCAAELIKSAKVLHRIAVIECERDLTDREVKRAQAAERSAIETIQSLSETKSSWCLQANSGDPRGSSIKLYPPDGSYNSWDGESYGVPIE